MMREGAGPGEVCLVYLVYLVSLVLLVDLVSLVHLVSLVQGTKPTRQTRTTRQTRKTTLHRALPKLIGPMYSVEVKADAVAQARFRGGL